jgi:prevent-host-death family protein
LAKLGQACYTVAMRVNVGQAKTELSKLLARVENGEDVEIARGGVPVARLVPVEPSKTGARFLAAYGSLAGAIKIGDDFEFSEAEIDAMLDDSE